MKHLKSVRILTAALAFSMLCAGPALAERYVGYVTAHSFYGNGTVRGPVRNARFGLQVRLPGGMWVYCSKTGIWFNRHRPCSETLRRHTVDFWEHQMDIKNGR